MALFDWNHDGKKNFIDNAIEYEMCQRSRKACEKEREQKMFNSQFDSGASGNTEGCGCFLWAIVIIVILAILGVR